MLTERQRWDVMREMVKQKNAEYRSFLFRFFDSAQMTQVSAITRDTFLSKCGISGQNLVVGLEDHATNASTKLSKTSWIDNLSSEDLLLFLDYRCRVLQDIYKHYKKYRNITKHDVRYMCEDTLVNKLSMYNNGKLTCGGRPEKVGSELPIKELGIDLHSLQSTAINQTVDELMERCVKYMPIEQVYQLASTLLTYNVDPMGHIVGCVYNTEQSEFLESALYKPSPKHKGFDIQGSPVYEYEEEYYSSAGNKINGEDVVFKSMDEEYTF